MKKEILVSGSLAAAFLSTSIGVVLLGLMVYLRGDVLNEFLTVNPATGTFGGIWIYSYAAWLALWGILYLVLRNRAAFGNLRAWTWGFLASMLLGIIIAEASFDWSSLFQ